MRIIRKIITELEEPYAIKVFNCLEGKRIFVANLIDKCIMFNPEGNNIKAVWENNGGTMVLWPLNDKPDFLAVQGFFKGFNAYNACIVRVVRKHDGSFDTKRFMDLPFIHRFCVVSVKDAIFLIAATLCENKDFKEDWSKPGIVSICQLPHDFSQRCELKPLIKNITKNHGMFVGKHNKKDVVLITGEEGVYEIYLPDDPNSEWKYERILDNEVSDISVFDIDEDGQDELITIEKFHGNSMKIYKYISGNYKLVYEFPISLGHVIWSGNIFGKPSIILGYREANSALVMLRKKPGKEYNMDITYIDENVDPTNIDVLQEDDVFRIFCSSGARGRVMLYELRENYNEIS